MAKCKRCGKGGLFHKVSTQGLCNDCERIVALEADERRLHESIEQGKAAYVEAKNAYAEINEKKQELYDALIAKAKKDALAVITEEIDKKNAELQVVSHQIEEHTNQLNQLKNAYAEINQKKQELYSALVAKAKKDALTTITGEIDKKNAELQAVSHQIEEHTNQLNQLIEEQGKSQKAITTNAAKLLKAQTLFKSIQYSAKRYFDEVSVPKAILSESIQEADELLSTTVKLKFNLMDVRELRKRYNQNNKIIQELLVKYQARYTTKTNMAIYKLMVIALEAELQNILYNLKYSKLDKAVKDVKAMTAKYQQIASEGNQNIAPTITKFIGEIEYLFIEAINIEYEYYIQQERIKEEQRALREQMKQEAAEQKRLEEERKKVEREEQKYKDEIASAQNQLALAATEAKDALLIKQLEARIAKMQSQLAEVENKKEDIIKLEHGKAGHIYIISNLGSFGDSVFKIGMTRRMVPQERIDELGDASVPFRFDIHSLIFSDNAPELENQLHKRLHNKRVNKINLRKEFFHATIDELEELVYSLEPSAEFNRTMLAEQYYQSMAVDEVPETVNMASTKDDDEETD
jgi:chromosome segregation ATPase